MPLYSSLGVFKFYYLLKPFFVVAVVFLFLHSWPYINNNTSLPFDFFYLFFNIHSTHVLHFEKFLLLIENEKQRKIIFSRTFAFL